MATRSATARLIQEAWRLPQGESEILAAAMHVSDVLADAGQRAAVIGGVAVGLHGHLRSTLDVDVYVPDAAAAAEALLDGGYTLNRSSREFRRGLVPVHLVTDDQTGGPPARRVVLQGVVTASLPDLIAMKLRSGLRSIVRAQDLADVIGLIRARGLRSDFAARLPRDLRTEFRKLVRAVREA